MRRLIFIVVFAVTHFLILAGSWSLSWSFDNPYTSVSGWDGFAPPSQMQIVIGKVSGYVSRVLACPILYPAYWIGSIAKLHAPRGLVWTLVVFNSLVWGVISLWIYDKFVRRSRTIGSM